MKRYVSMFIVLTFPSLTGNLWAQPLRAIPDETTARVFYLIVNQLAEKDFERAVSYLSVNLGVAEKEAEEILYFSAEVADSLTAKRGESTSKLCAQKNTLSRGASKAIVNIIRTNDQLEKEDLRNSLGRLENQVGIVTYNRVVNWIDSELKPNLITSDEVGALAAAEVTDAGELMKGICGNRPRSIN